MTNQLKETAPKFETVKAFGRANGGHPRYEANLERTPYADQTHACCYCGKFTGSASATYAYLLSTSEFSELEYFQTVGDDCNLGFYPVGSDCAKKLKAAGVPLYDFEGKRK